MLHTQGGSLQTGFVQCTHTLGSCIGPQKQEFFRTTASSAKCVLAIVEAFVLLSVRPSQCSIMSKQCKLVSQDLHSGLPQGL